MNKNWTIGIVAVIVIAGGWYFWGGSNKQVVAPTTETPATTNTSVEQTPVTATQTVPATKTVTVTYDGKSFSPSIVTIKNGDSVTFINSSTGGMSVASNPHPTHTIYPEFDQYKTSAKGQKEFTFTFTKVGSWGYHNHLNPGVGGTVVVQ